MVQVQFSDYGDAQDVDIAIIGAGISGLYCAWRLIEHDPGLRIAVIERLNRTGGRLDTDIIDFGDGVEVREEEGGMRFSYDMIELMNLTKALGLCNQIVQFPMSSADNTNRYYLRGRNFTLAEANASGNMIWSEIYDLKTEEIGLSPTELVTIAFNNVLAANGMVQKPGEPPEFYTKFRETATWKGKTMNEWQLWGLLRDMNYSEECIRMLTETIGFEGPFLSLANAGAAFQILADFPKDPEYFTFERGFSTLPNTIVSRLEADHDDAVQILLSTNVDAITEDGAYVLTMTQAPGMRDSKPIVPHGTVKTIRANRLIMAVATKGAEELFLRSPALRDGPEAQRLWDNIHSVLPLKLQKINLYFNSPWWENDLIKRPAVQFGPNFTGLPINSVYPFYALPEKRRLLGEVEDREADLVSPPIRGDAAAALTIYCDFNNTHFWQGLQNIGPMFCSPMQEEQNHKKPQTLFPASQAVVDEARKQLQALFGVNDVPEPVLTSYRLWNGEDDFEFAYHQWRMNVVDSEVRDYLAAPRDNLHFCNEAISDMQGWVNGSLRSCDLALKYFGIDPLPDDPCQKSTELRATAADPSRSRRLGLWGA